MISQSVVPLKCSNIHKGLKGRYLFKTEVTAAAMPTHLDTSIENLKKYFAILVVVDKYGDPDRAFAEN